MNQSKTLKRAMFYLIAILLPLLILVLAEFALRAGGYGQVYPLFIDAQGVVGYQEPNPDLIKRYFHRPELAPDVSPDSLLFPKFKAKDTFRIVIQGGSTAAGFPFGRFGSLTGMLQTRLKRLYPEKNIEVISTAMSSVNTYTLLDTAKEIIDIQPDLILIYAGHNEYLGVMGVGSAYAGKGSRGANLLYLKLKDLRLFQFVQETYYALFAPELDQQANKAAGQSATLMAKVAKEKDIALGSELYQAGLEQFTGNLELLLSQYKQDNIPVMISTLASNEAEQKPFSSAGSPDFSELNKALYQGSIDQALSIGERLIKAHPDSADAHYYLAKAYQAQQMLDKALLHYTQASDLDLLRFRAPSEFNRIIQESAKANSATLIDAQGFMRLNNQSKLIDRSVMYEHLHPNKLGYFLLAEAFVQRIIENKIIAEKAEAVSTQQAWQDIPLSEVDVIYADFKIEKLMADYPFTDSPKQVVFENSGSVESGLTEKRMKGEPWLQIQQELLGYYQRQDNLPEAAKIAGILFDALPHRAQIAEVASLLYRDTADFSMALYYARKASQLEPNNLVYKMALSQMYYNTQQLEKSLEVLKQVLVLDPEHKNAKFYLSQLSQHIGKQ